MRRHNRSREKLSKKEKIKEASASSFDLNQEVTRANEEYAKNQGGLLSVARIVAGIQASGKWTKQIDPSTGKEYTQWKKFCSDSFDFKVESIDMALRVVKSKKVEPIANQIGIAKAYALYRLGEDNITPEDLAYAQSGVSLRELEQALSSRLKKRSVRQSGTDSGGSSGDKGFDLKTAVKGLFEGSEDISYLSNLQELLHSLYYQIEDKVNALKTAQKETRPIPERPNRETKVLSSFVPKA